MEILNKNISKNAEDIYFIEWSIKVDTGSISDYYVKIGKSYDPGSGFNYLVDNDGNDIIISGSEGVQDSEDTDLFNFSFSDDFIKYNTNRVRYYRIYLFDSTDSLIDRSSIFFIGDDKDGVIDTIRYIEDILNNYYAGSEFYLLKVNKSGERCDNCWDSFQQVQKFHNCSVCNGTGYKNPIYEKHIIFINKDSEPFNSDVQNVGEKTQDIIKCRASNIVLIDNRDILIEKNTGVRYQVTGSIQHTKLPMPSSYSEQKTKADYIVSQLFAIKELNKDHEFYNMQIDTITPPKEV